MDKVLALWQDLCKAVEDFFVFSFLFLFLRIPFKQKTTAVQLKIFKFDLGKQPRVMAERGGEREDWKTKCF